MPEHRIHRFRACRRKLARRSPQAKLAKEELAKDRTCDPLEGLVLRLLNNQAGGNLSNILSSA
jgi:hypothetical protein